jgi:DNA-binding MarR family transcriptional regulator
MPSQLPQIGPSLPLPQIGLSVKRLQMRHHRELNAALAPLDLSLVQWDALRHLHENPDASLHRLAELTFQTDQAFGSLAGRMVDKGLIERVPGPGRAIHHRITGHGSNVREQGQALVEQALAESFAPLTATELAMFESMLARLLTNGS